MVKFTGMMTKVKKDATNPFFKNKYASLSNIIEATQKPLSECGLAVLQLPAGENMLTTMLIHETGEYIAETYTMKPAKSDPQGVGSAITYQRRYAMGAILNLNIDEDDDGNEGSKLLDKPAVLQRLKMCKSLDTLKSIWTETKDKEDKEILAAVKDKQAELAPKPEIAENTKEFKTAIDWLLESPSNTMERLKRKYKLDDKVEQSLINAVKAAENGGKK